MVLRSAVSRLGPVRLQGATTLPASTRLRSGGSSITPDLASPKPSTSYFCPDVLRATRCFATTDVAANAEKQDSEAGAGSATSSSHQGGSDLQKGSDEVSISYRGTTVMAQAGTKLRTAMLRGGISPHNGKAQVINCRGLGTCGTCAVEVRTGRVQPPEWSGAEQLRLNFPPHSTPNNQRLRLACQVSCQSDLEVAKYDGFWGQGSVPRGPILAGEIMQAPLLGELEYVMDAKERRKSTPKRD